MKRIFKIAKSHDSMYSSWLIKSKTFIVNEFQNLLCESVYLNDFLSKKIFISKLKTVLFKTLFDIISLSVIYFSIYDSDIKIDENEEILKTTYKEKKHIINQVKEKLTTFSIARKLCSYTVIMSEAFFLKTRKRFIW